MTPGTVASFCPWNFPGKSNGVGCHFLFHGIFLTQESKLGLPAQQVDSLPSEPPGKPLEVLGGSQKEGYFSEYLLLGIWTSKLGGIYVKTDYKF